MAEMAAVETALEEVVMEAAEATVAVAEMAPVVATVEVMEMAPVEVVMAEMAAVETAPEADITQEMAMETATEEMPIAPEMAVKMDPVEAKKAVAEMADALAKMVANSEAKMAKDMATNQAEKECSNNAAQKPSRITTMTAQHMERQICHMAKPSSKNANGDLIFSQTWQNYLRVHFLDSFKFCRHLSKVVKYFCPNLIPCSADFTYHLRASS